MLIIRDVVSLIAGRKQLKHRSKLYDLPRTDIEIDINNYNPILLIVWEGNMDIQFIGEKSSFLTYYVIKYMNKPGKCELSDTIVNSKNDKNKSLASFFGMSVCDSRIIENVELLKLLIHCWVFRFIGLIQIRLLDG